MYVSTKSILKINILLRRAWDNRLEVFLSFFHASIEHRFIGCDLFEANDKEEEEEKMTIVFPCAHSIISIFYRPFHSMG